MCFYKKRQSLLVLIFPNKKPSMFQSQISVLTPMRLFPILLSLRCAVCEQHRALGDVDDSSLCVSPLPSNAKTAWLIECAGSRPSCANCDMLHSEGSLNFEE